MTKRSKMKPLVEAALEALTESFDLQRSEDEFTKGYCVACVFLAKTQGVDVAQQLAYDGNFGGDEFDAAGADLADIRAIFPAWKRKKARKS